MTSVALDACVFIEAIKSYSRTRDPRASTNPARVILVLAENQAFELMLLPFVSEQVERNLAAPEFESLDTILSRCLCLVPPAPSKQRIEQVYKEEAKLQSTVRDVDDWEIAASVYLARPDYFVSSNDRDFNSRLDPCLRGTRVVTPRRFLAVFLEAQGP